MTLRLRLVIALAALLTAGLAVFGVATYARYSRSEYQRLDQQLQSLIQPVTRQLEERAGVTGERAGPGDRGGERNGPTAAPTGTYTELRDASGTTLTYVETFSGSTPALPATVATDRPFTVGSTAGSGTWRVRARISPGPDHRVVIVAVPTTEVASSLRQLVLTEAIGGLALLALLGTGSWLIVRRGLRPLEHMAYTARSINAGDLSQRVAPADGRGEVGQLGLALNSMLGELEGAFHERDATEQKLRQFLADAAHELRTPLTSIRGFAELFRLGTASDHVDRDVIMRRIEEESTRMKTLVDDLLLLARLDQTQPVEASPVDLAVLAADACSDAVAADRTRPVTLDAAEPVIVDGVRQAIANLVANALRHTPAGTAIDVAATSDGTDAIVRVRDHGTGLSDEAIAHVFDRFWQADRARVGKGAGLGLSIVAGIAREHGGTATATNAPDGGACFIVRLPLRQDA